MVVVVVDVVVVVVVVVDVVVVAVVVDVVVLLFFFIEISVWRFRRQRPDGRIGLIDFGQCRRLTSEQKAPTAGS